MSRYTPDAWVVIKIQSGNEPVLYKLLAGWYGGYLDGDSWKLNSGITKVTEEGDSYIVWGYSGSTYKCFRESERLTGYTSRIYNQFKENMPPEVELSIVPLVDMLKDLE